MQKLNFPPSEFKIRIGEKEKEIFDCVRKKYVALTPEEWVRQNMLHFLIENKSVPMGRIKIEMPLKIQKLSKRADMVVFNDFAQPLLMVECKAPEIMITQAVFEQISIYNKAVGAKYLLITNGLTHFFYEIIVDGEKSAYQFKEEIPDYDTMKLGHELLPNRSDK